MSKRFIISFAAAVASAACLANGDRNTVRPQDDGRALVNPGMGWTMHYYSNVPRNYGSTVEPGDAMAWFPGCSVCYLRIPWAYLEPEEGVYNWSALDTPAQRWIERGGQVAFRITCSESWLEYATPKWVFDAGARGVGWRDRPDQPPPRLPVSAARGVVAEDRPRGTGAASVRRDVDVGQRGRGALLCGRVSVPHCQGRPGAHHGRAGG